MTTTLEGINPRLQDYLLSTVGNQLFIIKFDQVEVEYADINDVNIDYVIENNIPKHQIDRPGGTIIHSAGNLSLTFVTDDLQGTIFNDLTSELINYISSKIGTDHTIVLSDNDILIDGNKTISGIEMRHIGKYDRVYTGIQIPINIDMEAIQNICIKPMNKVPKALSEFGITSDEMIEFVTNWWTTYCDVHNVTPDGITFEDAISSLAELDSKAEETDITEDTQESIESLDDNTGESSQSELPETPETTEESEAVEDAQVPVEPEVTEEPEVNESVD